ncbi:MAG: inorganic diphosphatase [Candidatus Paceibacterota bacterium]
MNLWHDLSSGKKTEMHVIIEVPRGSKNKYEIDKETGLIALDRVMHTSQDIPFDYGFVPQTLWDDDDALDVVILTTYPLFSGLLVRSRPVALMKMVDSGDPDDKVIAVPADDPRWKDTKDLKDINKHLLKEMEHFYSTYKDLQGKKVEIKGFKGKKEAENAFERSRKLYKEKYSK